MSHIFARCWQKQDKNFQRNGLYSPAYKLFLFVFSLNLLSQTRPPRHCRNAAKT